MNTFRGCLFALAIEAMFVLGVLLVLRLTGII
jgi:hypothetical protein